MLLHLKSHFLSALIGYFLQPLLLDPFSRWVLGYHTTISVLQRKFHRKQWAQLSKIAHEDLSLICISLQISGQRRKILEMKPRRASYHLPAEDLQKNSFIYICLLLLSFVLNIAIWSTSTVYNFLYNPDTMFKLPIGMEIHLG